MMKLKLNLGMLAIAMAVVVGAGPAMAQPDCEDMPLTPMPPSPGDFNFCGALDTVYCSLAPLSGAVPEIAMFAGLVMCETADINGEPIEEEPYVQPNGMLDGEYELGVIAAVLNNPAFNQNGLTHADTLAAFDNNFTILKTTVVDALTAVGYLEMVNMMAPYLIDSLSYALAGYAILGDDNSLAALDALLGLLADIGVTPPDPEDFTTMGAWFAHDADADGDGCTNREEYAAYAGAGAATYVENALNPAVFPEGCGAEGEGEGEGEIPGEVVIVGPGLVEVNSRLELRAVTALTGTFTWLKNEELLEDETGSSLVIDNVNESDSGAYRVIVDTGGKAL
ncbi:MAG TPA: hypothetical protein ENN65_03890, partial [Candidatus Hydrogenedentes bacterium]|nr:hypothetical protein [Candidatus Hydrogenedentota bacterium]